MSPMTILFELLYLIYVTSQNHSVSFSHMFRIIIIAIIIMIIIVIVAVINSNDAVIFIDNATSSDAVTKINHDYYYMGVCSPR